MEKQNTQAVIETVAGFHGRVVNKEKPLLEAEFPLDGSRFAGQIPPVVPNPVFSIRKKAIKIFTLAEYVKTGVMTQKQKEIISKAVQDHKNILVIGGTGSGKTTLVNAIIEEMTKVDPDERIFIIEDTGEIQCSAKNFVQYHTTNTVDMTALLKTALRMRPDRICIGEVRGSEALDLIDAWNTGHEGGIATLHANDVFLGLTRLRSLISRHKAAPREIEPLIGEIAPLIIHIAREKRQRIIKNILQVKGFNYTEGYIFENFDLL